MRKLRGILLVILCVLLFASNANAVADDRIDNLTMEISVDRNGCCQITATANVSFASSPKEFYFPLNARAGSITASGAEYDTSSRGGVDYVVFSSGSGFSGKHSFSCTYSLPCMVSETVNEEDEPVQQLLIDVIDGGFDYRIMEFSLVLTSAYDITARPSWLGSFRDPIDNSITFDFEGKKLTVSSVQELVDQETLQMTLFFSKRPFTIVNEAGRTLQFCSYAFIVLLALAILYWYRTLRSRLLLASHCTSPVSEATAGEIPCQLFGRQPDIASVLAHWGNLGYLTICRKRNGRILLTKQMDMDNERSAAERRLFNALFRGENTTCDARSRRFYAVCRSAGAPLLGQWISRSFERKTGNPKILHGIILLGALVVSLATFDALLPPVAVRWVFLPLLCLLGTVLCAMTRLLLDSFFHRQRLLCLLCGAVPFAAMLVFSIFAGTIGLMIANLLVVLLAYGLTIYGGRRTHSGEETVKQLLGLRKALAKFERQDALQRLDNDWMYFYRTLPYADCLGVGPSFTKQFQGLSLEDCPWLRDLSFTPRTPSEFYKLYDNLMTSIRTEPKGLADRIQEILGHRR